MTDSILILLRSYLLSLPLLLSLICALSGFLILKPVKHLKSSRRSSALGRKGATSRDPYVGIIFNLCPRISLRIRTPPWARKQAWTWDGAAFCSMIRNPGYRYTNHCLPDGIDLESTNYGRN